MTDRAKTIYGKIIVIRDDADVAVEIAGYYEPAQNGGMIDPSWPAHVTLESSSIELSRDEINDAEQVLLGIAKGE